MLLHPFHHTASAPRKPGQRPGTRRCCPQNGRMKQLESIPRCRLHTYRLSSTNWYGWVSRNDTAALRMFAVKACTSA
eukprot:11444197-Alexandrium_andersonii.AAC.1